MRRTPLKQKTPLRKVSAKRKAYRQSDEGKAALEYMRQVKALPCVICNAPPPSDAHHCFCERFGSSRASDWDVIPLCRKCHTDGPNAIHNGKQSWITRHGKDYEYIEQTRATVRMLSNEIDG